MRARSDDGGVSTASGLARLLRGDAEAWAAAAAGDADAVCRAAERHGVQALLAGPAARLASGTRLERALCDRLRAAAAQDAVTERAIRALTDACASAGVRALLIKGADLAYSCYARPHLRPRVDTDLLVDAADREACRAVLCSMGYEAVAQTGGDLLMYQQPFVVRSAGIAHTVDLHWRVTNPQRFASTLAFDELWNASEPRAVMGPAARGLSNVHAMLLACVHRVAHHYDADRLIWTYDVHLMTDRLTPEDWSAFVALATSRGAAGACVRSLDLAVERFGALLPAHARLALVDAARTEPSTAQFLGSGQRHVSRIWSDFVYLPTWTARVRLARQHVFPPARYMRDVYAPGSASPLPWLYVRRVWSGARRWMARA